MQCGLTGVQQATGICQARAFFFKRTDFIFIQRQAIKFLDLIAQHIETRIAVLRCIAQPFQLSPQCFPLTIGGGKFCKQICVTGIIVQQLALHIVFKQRLMFMLAMNIYQYVAKGLQRLDGHGNTINVALRTAFRRDSAAQYAFNIIFIGLGIGISIGLGIATGIGVGIQLIFHQPCLSCSDSANVKCGADVGACTTVTYHTTVGTITQYQIQCINDDGFARAGFTREHGHAVLEIQLQLVDDGKIAYMNVG